MVPVAQTRRKILRDLSVSMGIRYSFGLNADGYNRKGSCDSIHLRKTLARFCMQCWLFATRSYEIRYGWPFSANRACKSSIQTVLLPWTKKELSPRFVTRRTLFHRVISCSMTHDQRRAKVADSRGCLCPALIVRHRA